MIEAQNRLLDLCVADYPHIKNDARRSLHKTFHKLAYPKTYDPVDAVKTDELAERLKAVLKGV